MSVCGKEKRLKILCHMLIDSLFRILLHTCIDGSIDAKTIRIDVVVLTVALLVLLAPTIKRIGFP